MLPDSVSKELGEWTLVVETAVGSEEFVVLRRRTLADGRVEFVTHVKIVYQELDEPSYYWGHYFQSFFEAVADYTHRCGPQFKQDLVTQLGGLI